MKRKIYITLIGGLGNQLFQYACAFNLANNLNAKLIIDDRGGFYFDKKFQRNNSLPKNLSYKRASIFEVSLLFVLRILKKTLFNKKKFLSLNNFAFIDETQEKKYISNFYDITKNKKIIYLIGFFQSEKYFLNTKKLILKKIIQNKIKSKKLNQLKKTINKRSLMIGIRMYEEAPQSLKKSYGGLEGFDFYNKSISIYKKDDLLKINKYKSVDYFLFDYKPLEGELPGGNSKNFDWNILKYLETNKPWFLSGGINKCLRFCNNR